MDGRGYSPGRSTSLFKASGLHPPQIVHPRCEASTFHSISTPLLRHSNEEGVRIPVRQGDHGPNHPWMEQLLLWMGQVPWCIMVQSVCNDSSPMESHRVRSRRRSACLQATGFTSSKATWHSPTRKLREGSSTATSLSRVAPCRSPCGTAPRRPSPQKREPNSWLFSSAPGGMSGGH